ncbi:MAG: CRISPR-associated protein Cas4 [Gammaproteobacteria bacterium]|nr:CRISPR-associated protein Cas4 [Gammaproteobacteria bacterium]
MGQFATLFDRQLQRLRFQFFKGHSHDEPSIQCRHDVTENTGVKVERALPLWSDRLGLIGKADLVEFHPDGSIYPVEFKHGRKRQKIHDDIQLAAQAMCLEDMLGRPVPTGAIYHASSHRRREVAITPELRQRVESTTNAIRAMLLSGVLPAPSNDERCRECSLKDICQPEAVGATTKLHHERQHLFDEEA